MKKFLLAAIAVMTLVTWLPLDSSAAIRAIKRPSEGGSRGGSSAPAAEPAPERTPEKAPAPQAEKPAAQDEAPKAAAQAPAAQAPTAQATPAAEEAKRSVIGQVGEVLGKIVLVECDQPLAAKQRLMAYDSQGVKRAVLKVTSSKGKNYYIASTTAGSAQPGYVLTKESEDEAFNRVSHSRRAATVKEFLELYPNSQRKMEIGLMLLRIALRSDFPAADGSRISGRINLTEKVGQKIELGRAMIKFDRFLIAMTDDDGKFAIEGIPLIDLPAKVALTVSDAKFQPVDSILIDIPAEKAVAVEKNIDVKLTPTFIMGKVVDDKGMPLSGAQVWTSPYTNEKLTDENGEFKISRKKKLDDSGNPTAGDEPMLGRDYEVFAYKQGYGAERGTVSAQSFVDNPVKPIALSRQAAIGESLPPPQVGLRENLDLMQYVVSAGAGPKINR